MPFRKVGEMVFQKERKMCKCMLTVFKKQLGGQCELRVKGEKIREAGVGQC